MLLSYITSNVALWKSDQAVHKLYVLLQPKRILGDYCITCISISFFINYVRYFECEKFLK